MEKKTWQNEVREACIATWQELKDRLFYDDRNSAEDFIDLQIIILQDLPDRDVINMIFTFGYNPILFRLFVEKLSLETRDMLRKKIEDSMPTEYRLLQLALEII